MADLFDIVVARKLSGGGGGSSDFSTAEVTITVNENLISSGYYWPFSIILSDELMDAGVYQQQELTETHSIVLYKGSVEVYSPDFAFAETSGAIVVDNDIAIVTGDCTITIS